MERIVEGDCVEVMRGMEANTINMVLTSPPYDNLRKYNGYSFNFEATAREIARILKPGGVVVWIVADSTDKGSETGTSFRQALYFKDLGLNLHDTMIWEKPPRGAVGSNKAYWSGFEYMFVLSKGSPKTFHPITDRANISVGRVISGTNRKADGTTTPHWAKGKTVGKYSKRTNVWRLMDGFRQGEHPATFPLSLARDHILSWSDEGDTILDPFLGSGTTLIACKELNRDGLGIEISKDYCTLAKIRLKEVAPPSDH